jgi:small subunit ribosomal protein S18
MVKNYELYYILDAEVSADKRTQEIKKVEDTIKADLAAENVVVHDEGAKKLAYPIKGARLGHYILVNFDVPYEKASLLNGFEKKLNVSDSIMRYIMLDITTFNAQKATQSINKKTEVKNHQDLNKGKITTKKDVVKHLGIKAIDYKDTDFLKQFASPYHKIFHRGRTGNTAKTQRTVAQAIKRARHMGLMSFTPKHEG